MFMMVLMALVIQEAVAAYRQRRMRAELAGWAIFFAAILMLAALSIAAVMMPAPEGPMTYNHFQLGNLVFALLAMWGSVALYERRTDFTR